MSILSSTCSGKYVALTKRDLYSRGFTENSNAFVKHTTGHEKYISFKHNGDKLVFYIFLSGMEYGYAYIWNLNVLEEVEKYWDEKNQRKKQKLKRKLLQRYGYAK